MCIDLVEHLGHKIQPRGCLVCLDSNQSVIETMRESPTRIESHAYKKSERPLTFSIVGSPYLIFT